MYEIHGIRTVSGREPPHGTMLRMRKGSLPGRVRVEMQLPGQTRPVSLGDLPIVDGAVSLPLKLLFL